MAILGTDRKHFSKQILFNLPLDFFHSSSIDGTEIYVLFFRDTYVYIHTRIYLKIIQTYRETQIMYSLFTGMSGRRIQMAMSSFLFFNFILCYVNFIFKDTSKRKYKV